MHKKLLVFKINFEWLKKYFYYCTNQFFKVIFPLPLKSLNNRERNVRFIKKDINRCGNSVDLS